MLHYIWCEILLEYQFGCNIEYLKYLSVYIYMCIFMIWIVSNKCHKMLVCVPSMQSESQWCQKIHIWPFESGEIRLLEKMWSHQHSWQGPSSEKQKPIFGRNNTFSSWEFWNSFTTQNAASPGLGVLVICSVNNES